MSGQRRSNRPKPPRRARVRHFHMPKGRYSGRRFFIWGALLLLVMTGYEFWIRFDTIRAMIDGFRQGYENLNLYELSGIPFSRYAYESICNTSAGLEIRNVMIWLLACIALSVLAICLRNRPMANYFILICDLGLFFFGTWILFVFSLNFTNWINLLKLVPLAMILAGCLINISQFYVRRLQVKKRLALSAPAASGAVPGPAVSAPLPQSSAQPNYIPLFPQNRPAPVPAREIPAPAVAPATPAMPVQPDASPVQETPAAPVLQIPDGSTYAPRHQKPLPPAEEITPAQYP